MFDRLVVTTPSSTQTGRKGYFMVSSAVLCVALVAGLVMSLFSADLSLGNGDLALVELIAPVPQPEVEPEPPAPEPKPQQQVVRESTPDKVPTRQVNMARLDETPPAVPDQVSTARNTLKERPKSGYFSIGKLDTDPAVGATSGRTTDGARVGGPNTGLADNDDGPVAKLDENDTPPPPPVKKVEPPVKKVPAIKSMGVINGKASSLPKPLYPAGAKAVRAQGSVSVKVLISESGQVLSADAVSGHPLLRDAAEAAARQARFTPTLLSGTPVKISGTIVYNFSL